MYWCEESLKILDLHRRLKQNTSMFNSSLNSNSEDLDIFKWLILHSKFVSMNKILVKRNSGSQLSLKRKIRFLDIPLNLSLTFFTAIQHGRFTNHILSLQLFKNIFFQLKKKIIRGKSPEKNIFDYFFTELWINGQCKYYTQWYVEPNLADAKKEEIGTWQDLV